VDLGNIVRGVFTSVLAQRSNPNRSHWPYRRRYSQNFIKECIGDR
jgi:hypothetical protein